MSRLWQIAYPDQIRDHDHMPGPKYFLNGLIDHIRKQGDHAVVFPRVEIPWTPRGITLNFHTTGYQPNTWHYKESFLKNWVQVDRLGYTGFHSWNVARGAMPVNEKRLPRMAKKLDSYIASRQSKYDQASGETRIGAPYLFFPLQKPQDETSLFGRFRPQQIVEAALPWCAQNHVKLVIKRHPFCHSKQIENWLESLRFNAQIVLTGGDVADLVEGAKAVLTVNSSVGFESLLKGRKLLTFGKAEYSAFATEVFDLGQLPSLLDDVENQPSARQSIEEFSAACLFDAHDAEDIADFYDALASNHDKNFGQEFVMPSSVPPVLDLSEQGNADPHILHGFSYAEEWGRWTNADHASLIFYDSSSVPVKALAQFDLYAYVKDHYPAQLFDILWNRQPVIHQRVIHCTKGKPEVRAEIIIRPGLNILTVVAHNPVRPADIPADFDVRKLGLRVEKILFERIGS